MKLAISVYNWEFKDRIVKKNKTSWWSQQWNRSTCVYDWQSFLMVCACSEECFDWWVQFTVKRSPPQRVRAQWETGAGHGPGASGQIRWLGRVCCLLWISNGFKQGHGLLVNHLSSKWWSDVMERKWGITIQHTVCILLFSPHLTFQTLWVYVQFKCSLKRLSFHLKSPTALKVSVDKTAQTLFWFHSSHDPIRIKSVFLLLAKLKLLKYAS